MLTIPSTYRYLFSRTPDPSTEVTFFNELLARIPTSKAPDAHVLLLATIARSKLMYGDNEGAKVDMDEAWKVLDNLSDVESRVRAAYYHVAADYYKVSSPFPRNKGCRAKHGPTMDGLPHLEFREPVINFLVSVDEGRVLTVLQEFSSVPRMHRLGGTGTRGNATSCTRSRHLRLPWRYNLQLWRTGEYLRRTTPELPPFLSFDNKLIHSSDS